MASLSGTVIPMPTPFDERGEVDEKVFREIIDFELRASVFPELCVELWRASIKKERIELKTRLAEAGWPAG